MQVLRVVMRIAAACLIVSGGWGSPLAAQHPPAQIAIFYTATAASQMSPDPQTFILDRVTALNDVLSASGAWGSIEVVHIGPTTYDESQRKGKVVGQGPTALVGAYVNDFISGDTHLISDNNRAAVANVHAARVASGADLVAVFVDHAGIPCGIGQFAVGPDDQTAHPEKAYSIISTRCNTRPKTAIAHEVGHNFGLRHDRATNNRPPSWKPDHSNFGYIDPDGQFVTIMAYGATCTRLYPRGRCVNDDVFSSPGSTTTAGCRPSGRDRCIPKPLGTSRANNLDTFNGNFQIVAQFYPATPARVYTVPNGTVDMGSVAVGSEATARVWLFNPTASSVTYESWVISGFDVNYHPLVPSTCVGTWTIPAYGGCGWEVVLTPSQAGANQRTVITIHVDGQEVNWTVQWTATEEAPDVRR